MGLNIKKNDTVKVIAGKEKGKTGRVYRVLPAEERLENLRLDSSVDAHRGAGDVDGPPLASFTIYGHGAGTMHFQPVSGVRLAVLVLIEATKPARQLVAAQQQTSGVVLQDRC